MVSPTVWCHCSRSHPTGFGRRGRDAPLSCGPSFNSKEFQTVLYACGGVEWTRLRGSLGSHTTQRMSSSCLSPTKTQITLISLNSSTGTFTLLPCSLRKFDVRLSWVRLQDKLALLLRFHLIESLYLNPVNELSAVT